MAKITFDADTHTYTLDGMPCPSVTEITRFLHYKAEYSDKESRDRAARKGTAIHELTALIDYGEDVEIPPELSGYVQAWKNFKRDYRVEILAIEQVVGGYLFGGTGCPLCGTLDRRAMIPIVARTVNLLAENGVKPYRIFVYTLIQDVAESQKRIESMDALGVMPFAQPYRDFTNNIEPTEDQKRLARWCNNKAVHRKTRFEDYSNENRKAYKKRGDA